MMWVPRYFCLQVILATLCSGQDYFDFNEWWFRQQVKQALQSVEGILDTTRHPVLLEDSTQHTYDDKYTMVERMTNTAVAASMSIFERLGVTDFETLLDWVHNQKRPVLLRFHMERRCVFDRKTERKDVIAEREVETTQGSGSGMFRTDTVESEKVKVLRTVNEYHWSVKAPYSLTLVSGTDEIDLQNHQNQGERATIVVSLGSANDQPPPPVQNATMTYDLNLTWLLQMLALGDSDNGQELATQFAIHREAESCRTPSRNDDVNKALAFQKDFGVWASDILSVFAHLKAAAQTDHNHGNSNRAHRTLNSGPQSFNPILPLFENSTVIGDLDLSRFLKHHKTHVDASIAAIASDAPSDGLISVKEDTLTYLIDHLIALLQNWKDTVAYIEKMLERQLIQAIGKRVSAKDFDEFVSFHAKKLFRDDYAPKPFSYAVRRGNQYPDGVVSLEAERYGETEREPIETMSRRIAGGEDSGTPSIYIPVNAATSVEIRGDRYLHGWIQHQWNHENHVRNHYLVARAHQFSSFLVILGVMGGSDKFLPKDAIIVQNKDKVLIDLLTDVLPSAKEFQDAISSLSDEQKAFAQAFRGMQLESSVFGVCIIQIKPQLERLLNLPDGSLTKEIQLTQDLMSLFVEYQIPSDLLSFDGLEDATVAQKVEAVREYVKAVMDVIEKEKQKQLEQEKQKRAMREEMYAPVSGPTVRPSSSPSSSPTGGPTARSMQRSRHMESETMASMASMTAEMHMSEPPMAFDQQEDSYSKKSQEATRSSQESPSGSPVPSGPASSAEDFTLIPRILDAKLAENDRDGALKSTTVKAGTSWIRSRQENLLLKPRSDPLSSQQRESEKNHAMDLLTAISRSGSLPIDASELHVVVALTHCFERDIMSTVIQDNINPIQKVERSLLLLGSTIQNEPETKLLAADKLEEIASEG